jgi:thioredoxin-dependent peroxiredoxin
MLNEGDKAPAFSGKDQNGEKIVLSDFKGKKVILYFYPEDDTPTCTIEACNLRDNITPLKKKGFVVLGVSANDEKSHKKFAEKFDLPFPLIADVDKKIIEAYGVWGDKVLFGHYYKGILRTTFVIDEQGKIEKIFSKVKSKIHTQQILEEVEK